MPNQSSATNESKNETKLLTLLLSSLAIFVVFRLVFLFTDVPELWGVNLLHYLPTWVGVSLSLAGIASIILSRNLKIGHGKETPKNNRSKVEKKEVKRTFSFAYVLVATALVLGILFLVFRIAWPFLGDGTTYFGFMFNFQAYGTITTQRTATPVLYLLYGIYYVFLKLANNDLNVFFPFTVMSFISGTLFVTFSFLFAKAFTDNSWMRFLVIIVLLTLGGSLLFFGYIETYPLQYACVLIYAYYSYRYLQENAKLVSVAAALLLCIAFHMQNILLLPSFVLLYSLRNTQERRSADRSKFVSMALVIGLPLMVVVYILSQTNVLGISPNDPANPFIPFSSSSYMQYSLFHGVHLLDILNEHLLLAAVPIIIIICCLITGRERINRKDPFVSYLLLNVFFVEAFLIGGNLGLGIARDWDICSSLGISLALLAVVLLKDSLVLTTNLKKFAVPIAVVAFSGVLPWIAVNTRIASAVERYEDIVEVYTPIVNNSIARVSYENLRKYYLNNDVDGELRTVLKMMQLEPTHADARIALLFSRENLSSLSSANKDIILLISERLVESSDSILKEETFDKIRLADPHSGESTTLGDFYEEFITFLFKEAAYISSEEALQRANLFITRHSSLPYGYELYGYIETMFNKNSSTAIPYLEKAISLDSMRARPHLYLAVALSNTGKTVEANLSFKRALALDSKWLGGIALYVIYLTNEQNSTVTISDLRFAQQLLTRIINLPPESSMDFHKKGYEHRVGTAQQLLLRVEKRLNEFQNNRALP